ncbi:hypothetical protein MTR67_033109 [Solanum verrucosum]|uniref:Uncharacterized protein n=1 Tax=Solanum verrucosum TaxID=315347 RepID=A0AAF0ZJV5_SOLVR|nr:hypothetical protein MTR67_033109 [Solanum verrucosum]
MLYKRRRHGNHHYGRRHGNHHDGHIRRHPHQNHHSFHTHHQIPSVHHHQNRQNQLHHQNRLRHLLPDQDVFYYWSIGFHVAPSETNQKQAKRSRYQSESSNSEEIHQHLKHSTFYHQKNVQSKSMVEIEGKC